MRETRVLVPALAPGVLAWVGTLSLADAQSNAATVNLTPLTSSGNVGKSGTAMPGTLPRAGDVGSVAPLFAGAGQTCAGAGYLLRRRFGR